MNTEEKVAYWLDIAQYDLETAKSIQQSGRYVYTVFMCQQAVEKLLKALYLKKYEKEAPRSHSLVYLEGLLNLKLDEPQRELLAELTSYYIEGRYPTYKQKTSQLVNEAKANELLKKTLETFIWLSSQIK